MKHRRKAVNKTPRDIIGAENVTALKHAGFVVVRLSDLSKLRAHVKSVFDILSRNAGQPAGNHVGGIKCVFLFWRARFAPLYC
jgi:hypothetical protein